MKETGRFSTISGLLFVGLMLSTVVLGKETRNQGSPAGDAVGGVELEGSLVLTPVMSRTTDSPDFNVRFVNLGKTSLEADLLEMRAGLLLDGRELSQRMFVWVGIVPVVKPGSHYDFQINLTEFLPGSERRNFSKALGRWRWQVPLSSGLHKLVYFLRKTGAPQSARIESNEVSFFWDDSQPLLYDPDGSETHDEPCPSPK